MSPSAGWSPCWSCLVRRGAADSSYPPPAGQRTTSTSPYLSWSPGSRYYSVAVGRNIANGHGNQVRNVTAIPLKMVTNKWNMRRERTNCNKVLSFLLVTWRVESSSPCRRITDSSRHRYGEPYLFFSFPLFGRVQHCSLFFSLSFTAFRHCSVQWLFLQVLHGSLEKMPSCLLSVWQSLAAGFTDGKMSKRYR